MVTVGEKMRFIVQRYCGINQLSLPLQFVRMTVIGLWRILF